MTRKQARKQSVGMCQTMTLSVIAFLFVFAGIFSAQLVRAEEGDTGSDTSSEVSDSSESVESSDTTETSEVSEEVVTEDAPATIEEEVSEEAAVYEVESDDSEVVVDYVVVDATSTDEESTSDTVVEEVFEMFSSFAPMFVSEEIPLATSSAQITAPIEDAKIHGVYTFTAEYHNLGYVGHPGLRWAIRANGECEGDTPIVPVFGNVDGATTSPAHTAGHFNNESASWDGVNFSATLDFSGLPQGEYCFAFNPNPKDSHRQTVKFFHELPGSIEIIKDVLGTDEETLDPTEFSVMLGAEEGFTSVSEASKGLFEELLAGTYTLTEIDETGMYDFVSMRVGTTTVTENLLSVEVVPGETTTVYVVNKPAVFGCMDEDAENYNPLATRDNESCVYPPKFVPECHDGIDNDKDGDIDFEDNGCSEEGDNDESDEKSGRHPGRPRTTGGQVLGAFTGDSSAGGSCGMYLNSYMRIGANNDADDVMKLQAFLNEQGYPMSVNGVFGATTEAAVKAFQKTHAAEILAPWGITDPTGYVYKMTRYVMNNMVCAGSEAKPVI